MVSEARKNKNSSQESAGNDTSSRDKYDDLLKLKELLDTGAITQEEFDREKAKVLDR